MIDLATLQTRRAALAQQLEEGKAQYAHLEQIIADLRRTIDMDAGALREIAYLIEACEQPIAVEGAIEA